MAKQRNKRLRLDKDLEVVVVNLTSGTFVYNDEKTLSRYVLTGFGDETTMTIEELQNMKSRRRAFLENMWIVIVDVLDNDYNVEDVIKYLRLENAYNYGIEAEYVDKFIIESDPNKFETFIGNTDTAISKRICERAIQLYRSEDLRDKNKMYMIADALKNKDLIEDLDNK